MQMEKAIEYIILVLTSQGAVCYPTSGLRLVAGLWCLSCFVLISSYCSTLISFMTSSNRQPTINSIYDLANNSHFHVTVEEGSAIESVFSKAEAGIFKYIKDDLASNPNLRCRKFDSCIDQVKLGKRVAISSASLLAHYISRDFEATGECRMSISKEGFLAALGSFALTKAS